MLKCVNDYSRMSDAELVNKALAVHAGMLANPVFANPPVTMDQLSAANLQFSNALVSAESRDKVKVSVKNKLRKALIADLSQLLAFVNAKANGDKPTLLSSGFTMGKERAGAYELGEVGYVKVSHGKNSGEVIVRYPKVDGAVSYQIDFIESPVQNDTWKSEPDTYLKHLLKGLTRGKEYTIRVRAIGRGGVESFSAPVTILVV